MEITSRSEVGAWRNTYAQIDLTLSGRDTADTKYPVEFAIMSDGGDTLYRRPEPLDIRTWRLRLIENIGSPEPGWRTGTDIGRSIGRMAMGPWRIAVDTIPRGWFHAWFDMHGRRVAKDSVRVRIRMMN
ncbi:MAG: hypothetical protein OXR82_18080 [Gammaproteobacteria bacterium]|nr:hypothetical protein [Gammaproteobacteria bacterium]